MAHVSKDFERMLEIARLNGCRVLDYGGLVKIFPANKSISPYFAHRSEKSFHDVRKYLKNKLGISILN